MKRIAVGVVLAAVLLGAYLVPGSAAAASSNMVVTPWIGLNVRTGPGLGYTVVTAMPNGTVIQSGVLSGGWMRVSYHGVSGWSDAQYLAPTSGDTDSFSSVRSDPPPSENSGGASSSITSIIYSAAARYGVSGDWLYNVAVCESGLNPGAASSAGAEGLFQFMPNTYYAYGSGDIWSAYNQADTAARMFSQGLSYLWVCAR